MARHTDTTALIKSHLDRMKTSVGSNFTLVRASIIRTQAARRQVGATKPMLTLAPEATGIC